MWQQFLPEVFCEAVIPHPKTLAVKTGEDDSRRINCLYLFAGAARKSDLPAELDCMILAPESEKGLFTSWNQVDILRDEVAHDLLDSDVRQGLLEDIRCGIYDIVIASPPMLKLV